MRQSLASVLAVAAVVSLGYFVWPMQPDPSVAQPPFARTPPADGPPGGHSRHRPQPITVLRKDQVGGPGR